MWSARFDGLLTGTAVALVLTLAAPANVALAQKSEAEIEAAIPVPDLTQPPPPTLKDIQPPAAPVAAPTAAPDLGKSGGSAANDGVPTPNLAVAPAPTAKDIGALPAPGPSEQAVTPPSPAPAKAAEAPQAPPTMDMKVADQLRGLADGKFDRIIGNHKERASIQAFYETRNYAPLWTTDGALNARGKAAIKYLAGVAADGLDPADYPTPDFAAGKDAEALAQDELKLDAAVLTFAHHAQTGRVNYTRVSADISYKLDHDTAEQVLSKLAASDNAAKTLDGFNPQEPEYKALKAALAKARMASAFGQSQRVHVDEGPILRVGMRDPRVVSVRKRLDVAGDKNNPLYDDAVANAVKDFQEEHDLSADGMLGRVTVRTMNAHHRASGNVVNTIIANMERWRWLPHHLGNPYVMVNIPDYTLRVVDNGKTVWKTKIVVGKPGKATPLISAEMKYITINPTWNVPPSIIRNEYLPVLREDPNALERVGLKMERNKDGTIRIYQPPGDRNALGRIRFNFPNKFLVYQHDTPDKYLFARSKRAYSHGCMRVQDPLKYAEVLLSLVEPQKGYTEARLHKMFGGNEININFPHPIPVHLTYQTAYVDSSGKLVLRDDIYGLDSALLAVLHGQRKVADIPIERRPSSSSKPVMMPAGLVARGGPSAPPRAEPSFFERLFGVPPDEPPSPRQYRRHTARGWEWGE